MIVVVTAAIVTVDVGKFDGRWNVFIHNYTPLYVGVSSFNVYFVVIIGLETRRDIFAVASVSLIVVVVIVGVFAIFVHGMVALSRLASVERRVFVFACFQKETK